MLLIGGFCCLVLGKVVKLNDAGWLVLGDAKWMLGGQVVSLSMVE